jgi:hypothetical protein
MKKSFYTTLFLFLAVAQLFSQAKLDTNVIRVGERAAYTLSLPLNQNIGWPLLKDTLTKDIEILGEPKIDTTQDFILWKIAITAFDSGYYAIPPITYFLDDEAQETNPLLLEVRTVPVDTTQTPKPIADIIFIPFSLKYWLKDNWIYLSLALLLLTGLAIFIWYLSKKPKVSVEPIEAPKPIIPLYIRITEKLKKIENEKLYEKNQVKAYYSQLSEAIRYYLEEMYNFPALELSNTEIFDFINRKPIKQDVKDKIQEILFLCDLAKFAKVTPSQAEHLNALKVAFEIVEITKPIDNPTKSEENNS